MMYDTVAWPECDNHVQQYSQDQSGVTFALGILVTKSICQPPVKYDQAFKRQLIPMIYILEPKLWTSLVVLNAMWYSLFQFCKSWFQYNS